jgi:mono/diheme cytochrome c family protein
MSRIQIQIFFGIILILATSFILIVYAVQEEERMEAFVASESAQAIEVGASLYETNCSGCHGLKGEGVPGLCPPLNDRSFFTDRIKEVGWSGTLEDYIVSTVAGGRLVSTRPEQYVGGGRPAMPAWSERYGGPLREDQIRDIARFILNWESTALGQVQLAEVVSPVSDDPVVRGELVYRNNGCGGCHQLGNISAGVVGPTLNQIGARAAERIEGYSAEDYIRESIVNPNAYVVEQYQPNIMPQNFGDIILESDLNDLLAFLLAQQ